MAGIFVLYLHCQGGLHEHAHRIHQRGIDPVAADQRVFRWHDHASLWFSLGVGLPLVMQVAPT